MGVRQIELINKFDNGLSGVAGDAGTTGVIVNLGNKIVTGHFWDMRTCPDGADDGHDHGIAGTQYDKTQLNVADDTPLGEAGGDVLAAAIVDQFGGLTSAAAPVYPAAPHCNQRGLSELGAYAVRRIVEKGIIFDPDHMSAAGQREALDLIEHDIGPRMARRGGPARYPALVSSHSWANDVTYQRIYHLGGTVAPMQADAATFADRWAQRRQWADEQLPRGIPFGMGYGADTNGFASQPGPRPDPARSVQYDADGWRAPIGDVTLYQQTSGLKDFDVTTDGVAHYGLYADWYREVALAADEQHPDLGGGAQLTEDMLAGAENYLQMWERAVYGGNDCVTDQSAFQVEDVHALLGGNVEGFLRAVGQPVDREGAVYTYCVEDEGGDVVPLDVVFDDQGNAVGTKPNDGSVTPAPAQPAVPAGGDPAVDATPAAAPVASPPPAEAPRTGVAADGHDHLHGAPAAASAGSPLPATGGGAGGGAMLLFGGALLAWAIKGGRRPAR